MTIKNKKHSPYLFHPYELAFCGFSNAGKTTLLSKIVKVLSEQYSVGYVKNDIHAFQMDKKGKDTERLTASGASKVYISDPNHRALISQGRVSEVERMTMYNDMDFTLIEGYKNEPINKIVILDSEMSILPHVKNSEITHIKAFVGQEPNNPIDSELPYFHRDDIEGITAFVKEYFIQEVQQPLYGLVLTGGKSRRMGMDKALLQYNDSHITQGEHTYSLLSKFCDKTFISSQNNQWRNTPLEELPTLPDVYLDMGPMGGILSAMHHNPEVSWFVLPCDLPNINEETLRTIVDNRDPFKYATSFEHGGKIEPLCTIYEKKSRYLLSTNLALSNLSLRKALQNQSAVHTIPLHESNILHNVNFKHEYETYQNKG